mmetsp:Transcript_22060/g.52451  ORF Transcript_22060/g.52451 Transcript_22060/m.52451 type:complete len:140 (-) Transcript_22060:103-522(-)
MEEEGASREAAELHYREFIEKTARKEELAEQVLWLKKQLVGLDEKRQNNRVAQRQIRTQETKSLWLHTGTMFLKLPKKAVAQIVHEDGEKINHDVSETTEKAHGLVRELKRVEGETTKMAEAFDLKPLSKQDMTLFGPS